MLSRRIGTRRQIHAIAGRVWERGGGPRDARALRKIAAAHPEDPIPHQLLADLHAARENPNATVAALEAALRLDPADSFLRMRLERKREQSVSK